MKKVIEYYSASSCGACHKMEPIVRSLAEEYGCKVIKYSRDDDVDVNQFNRKTVMQIPCIIFPDGERFIGTKRESTLRKKFEEMK